MKPDICGGCWSYLDEEDGACPHCDHGEEPNASYADERQRANEAAELAWEIRMENEYERSMTRGGEE